MTTIAPPPDPSVVVQEALRKTNAIFARDASGFLWRHNVERNEEIELLALSIFGSVDTLLLGERGVGKTWAIELLVNHCLTDMALFDILLAKDMSADEVLGPRDIMAMKQGQIKRILHGFLPTANVGHLDEVFKASAPMLNPLLDITATRRLKVGGSVIDCSQLICVLMSSNELPDREDLEPFRDRIGITKYVLPVRTPEGRRRVTDIQLDFQSSGITDPPEPLTLAEVLALKDMARRVTVPDSIRNVMVDMQQKLWDAGHPPSQRRIGQVWKVCKARALLRGADTMGVDDFLPAQHMFWSHTDHAASARQIVLDVASVFTRKAARLRESMEPVTAELESLKSKIDSADSPSEREDLVGQGFPLLRQLRVLRKEGRGQIREGQAQGQDTSMVEEVIAEIDRVEQWTEKAITGVDED